MGGPSLFQITCIILVCIGMAWAAEPTEYVPINGTDTCRKNYIKTTDCRIEIDKLTQHCCKSCGDDFENPDPAHSNVCVKKQEVTTISLIEVDTPSPTPIPTGPPPIEEKTEGQEENEISTAGMSMKVPTTTPEEITANTTGGTEGEKKPVETKLDCASIAVIAASVAVLVTASIAVAVWYFRLRPKKQQEMEDDKGPSPGAEANGADDIERGLLDHSSDPADLNTGQDQANN